MRKTTIGVAVAFACLAGSTLAGSAALAEPIHHNDHHGAKDFGGGGWSQNVHVRPFRSGAIALATTNVTVSRPVRRDFDRRLHDFDSGCPLAALSTLAARSRRAGCK